MVFAYNGVYFKISEAYALVHNSWAFYYAYLPSYLPTLILFVPSVAVPSALIAQVLMQMTRVDLGKYETVAKGNISTCTTFYS